MALRRTFCLLRHCKQNSGLLRVTQSVGYKSQYSIEKLYPNSNLDFISNPGFKHTQADNTEEFSGYIPIEKLDIRYSRSGGAGGQHVNKVNTKVEVRFHVASAEWLPPQVKAALIEQEHNRLTSDGFLIVRSERTRKQLLNQADCMEKIREIIRTAIKEPYTPTPQELQVKAQRLEKARRGMLKEKRQHSQKKQSRQKPSTYSL